MRHAKVPPLLILAYFFASSNAPHQEKENLVSTNYRPRPSADNHSKVVAALETSKRKNEELTEENEDLRQKCKRMRRKLKQQRMTNVRTRHDSLSVPPLHPV